MATLVGNRSVGTIVLGVWLILHGVASLMTIAIPPVAMAALALIAGVLILVGR